VARDRPFKGAQLGQLVVVAHVHEARVVVGAEQAMAEECGAQQLGLGRRHIDSRADNGSNVIRVHGVGIRILLFAQAFLGGKLRARRHRLSDIRRRKHIKQVAQNTAADTMSRFFFD